MFKNLVNTKSVTEELLNTDPALFRYGPFLVPSVHFTFHILDILKCQEINTTTLQPHRYLPIIIITKRPDFDRTVPFYIMCRECPPKS